MTDLESCPRSYVYTGQSLARSCDASGLITAESFPGTWSKVSISIPDCNPSYRNGDLAIFG